MPKRRRGRTKRLAKEIHSMETFRKASADWPRLWSQAGWGIHMECIVWNKITSSSFLPFILCWDSLGLSVTVWDITNCLGLSETSWDSLGISPKFSATLCTANETSSNFIFSVQCWKLVNWLKIVGWMNLKWMINKRKFLISKYFDQFEFRQAE